MKKFVIASIMVMLMSGLLVIQAPAATLSQSAACVDESSVVQPASLGKVEAGKVVHQGVPIPGGCGSLIFDGQVNPGGVHEFIIFGLPVDAWSVVGGTWYAIRADLDPAAIAFRIAAPGDRITDLRSGEAQVIFGGVATEPTKEPQASPVSTTTCLNESAVVTPEFRQDLGDGRILAKQVPIPPSYQWLLMDGIEVDNKVVLRIFGMPVDQWPIKTATWYAVCGANPQEVALRIAKPGQEVWDMTKGGVLIAGSTQAASAASTAPATASSQCSTESTVVKPENTSVANDQRTYAVGINPPAGFGSVIFDGQLESGGPRVLEIYDKVEAKLYAGGTWYAICSDPVPVAKRIAGDSSVTDFRSGAPVKIQ